MHMVIQGQHYKHAVGGVVACDQQRGSGRAYEEASADRKGSRPGSGRLGIKDNEHRGNRASSLRRTRLKRIAGIFPFFSPFLAHSGGCVGLVGADVVKNSGHK